MFFKNRKEQTTDNNQIINNVLDEIIAEISTYKLIGKKQVIELIEKFKKGE